MMFYLDPPREAPPWLVTVKRDIARDQHRTRMLLVAILRKLGHVEEVEELMRQSTQDLIDAVGNLQTDIGTATTAIDALVAASDSGDDGAIEAQINILKGLGPTLKAHIPSLSQTATAVAQAPADEGATVTPPAPAA